MADLLRSGQSVITDSGKDCVIEKILGSGTQGEVYMARLAGQPVALKWYYIENIPGVKENQYFNLHKLVEAGRPNDKFLWPIDLATSPDVDGFGYIMPLRGPNFKSITDWMYRRVQPSMESLLTAGYQLANSFYDLHAMGMCYRDINFGNIFFDPDTGDVAICDNDNASVDEQGSLVLGTPDFMAPEIVRRQSMPNTNTDRYSLAVLMFYMFFLNHPLYGKRVLGIRCLDAAAKNMLCGTNPLYIFDPSDRSNEAVPESVDELREAGANALDFWPVYPEFFKHVFNRSFTAGLNDPNSRVTETEWRNVMIQMRDLIVHCPHCGAENFYNKPKVKEELGREVQACWHCGRTIHVPPRVRLTTSNKASKTMAVLRPGKKLYPHHTDDEKSYDFSTVTAMVVQHPTDKNLVGIVNATATPWKVTAADGAEKTVEPRKVAVITDKMKIDFGNMEAEIKV